MKVYSRLLKYLLPFWKLVVLSVFLTVFYVLFNNLSLWVSVDFIRELFDPSNLSSGVAQPSIPITGLPETHSAYEALNQTIKKLIIREDRFNTLKIVCGVIFFSFLLKNIVFFFRRVLNSFIELNIILNIRKHLYDRIIRLPLSYFERNHSGNLTSIVFNDVTSVNAVLTSSFGRLLMTPLQVLANMTILFMISFKLSLITFTIVPVSAFVIIKIGQSIRRKSRRVFQQIANVMSVFQETVTSIRIVKAFTNEEREKQHFDAAIDRHFKLNFRAARLGFLASPVNETLGVSILVALLWYGGNLVYTGGGLNPEDFIRYLVFLFTLFQPLKELSGLNNRIQQGMAAAERIFRTLDENPEIYEKPGAKKLEGFSEAIEFKDVNFQYNTDEPGILKDINLRIEQGEMVAFVGHSGAGKSTLVDLIPRFYDVDSGSITVDGVDIRDFSLQSLRGQIGVVTQESILFNDSVQMNIAYGLNGVSEKAIVDAAKAANAWEFIKTMGDGLDTIIGEKGIKLSGGQKQRLSIARAVLKNPPILILDEATSSLDSESERLVQEAIDKLMHNRTVLVIAHRLSTIMHADKIVVLHGGRIKCIGNHSKLLKDCQTYRSLYEIQFRNQLEESKSIN